MNIIGSMKTAYARSTRTDRIALPILYASLAVAMTMLALNPPRRESPTVNIDTDSPVVATLSGTGNVFTGSFVSEQDGLRSIWFHIGFEKLSSEEKDLKPRILLEVRSENGEIIVSDYVKLTNLRRNRPNDLGLGRFIDARGRRLTYSITSENIPEDKPLVIRANNETAEKAAVPEYAPNPERIAIENPYLLLPSLLMAALLIALVRNPSDGKPSSRTSDPRHTFYLYALPILFVNGIFFMLWVNHFAPIDEHSHFEYVKTVAEGRLPLLFEEDGGRGLLEAFQPPLYYATAAPIAFILDGTLREHAVRLFGLLVYLGFVSLAFETHLALRKRFAFLDSDLSAAFLITFVALSPALIIRSVCISNGTFAAFLVLIQALLLIRSINRPLTAERAIATGTVTGLSMLSRFTNLYTAPIVAWDIMIRGKRKPIRIVLFAAGILALLAPWFTWNLATYGSLTANRQAIEYQTPTVNPDSKTYGLTFIRERFLYMFDTMSRPEEYGIKATTPAWYAVRTISWVSVIGLATAVLYALTRIRRIFDPTGKDYPLVLLAGFPILNVAQQFAVVLLNNWPVMLGRYLHASLPFFAIFFLLALDRIIRNRSAVRTTLLALSLGMIVLNVGFLAIVAARFG